MAKIRRSKTNGMYFQDIPKNEALPIEEILKLLRRKYAFKEQRVRLVNYIREKRKDLYNLSMTINELETKIDNILIEKLKEDDKHTL
jgi:hypothetical protein